MRNIWKRIRHAFGTHYFEEEWRDHHRDGYGYTTVCCFCRALGGWKEPPEGYPVRLH